MPPRYAYWTILIDQKPTAFRARDRNDLVPTFQQLKRTNRDVVIRYFARGKLWDSPEQAHWAAEHARRPRERRSPGWRPGGEHRDPRARFKEKQRERNQQRRADRFAAKQGKHGPPRGPRRRPDRSGRPQPDDAPERRREAEPPRPGAEGVPEPPPQEKIVIKPDPPERG